MKKYFFVLLVLFSAVCGIYADSDYDPFDKLAEKLLDDFENAIKNNFKQPKEFDEMRESTFAFTDKNNSSRIVLEIKKMKIFD